MSSHDSVKTVEEQAVEAVKDMHGRISPKFDALTSDIQEVMEKADDPKVVAALMFKLAEERRETNRLLEGLSKKYDDMMFELKTKHAGGSPERDARPEFDLLPEQDRTILHFIGERGQATAFDIQAVLNYRGLNGASQRLNKLAKEGFLERARSGKKVLYLAKP